MTDILTLRQMIVTAMQQLRTGDWTGALENLGQADRQLSFEAIERAPWEMMRTLGEMKAGERRLISEGVREREDLPLYIFIEFDGVVPLPQLSRFFTALERALAHYAAENGVSYDGFAIEEIAPGSLIGKVWSGIRDAATLGGFVLACIALTPPDQPDPLPPVQVEVQITMVDLMLSSGAPYIGVSGGDQTSIVTFRDVNEAMRQPVNAARVRKWRESYSDGEAVSATIFEDGGTLFGDFASLDLGPLPIEDQRRLADEPLESPANYRLFGRFRRNSGGNPVSFIVESAFQL